MATDLCFGRGANEGVFLTRLGKIPENNARVCHTWGSNLHHEGAIESAKPIGLASVRVKLPIHTPFRPRSAYPETGLLGLFFQPEQCFSLTTIQPEQCFQPISAKFQQTERGRLQPALIPAEQARGLFIML